MPSYLQDNLKQHCSGCGACVQICGAEALRFTLDEEGFIYPEIKAFMRQKAKKIPS